jgi:hypothetical protein
MSLYNQLTHERNSRLYHAMEFYATKSFEMLLYPRNLLVDGEAHYRALVVQLKDR